MNANANETQLGNCIGFARIALDSLSFEETCGLAHRQLSNANVQRITKIFKTDECRRLEESNFVDCVIDEKSIEPYRDCVYSRPPQDWSSSRVISNFRVQCLSGLHRVQAARTFLPPDDRWWVARLFATPQGIPALKSSSEAFRNERAHTDGEILYKILMYGKSQDLSSRCRWLSRLTSSKQRDLKPFLRKFGNSLNKLLDFPGLFTPIKLGTLHRLLTIKCDEEIVNYLSHVSTVWSGIFHNVDAHLQREMIDSESVEMIEMLAPAYSKEDSSAIKHLMDTERLFPKLVNPEARARLLRNIQNTSYMIPSLNSFFEDLKFLEPAAKAVRMLLPDIGRCSILQHLRDCFRRPNDTLIEYAKNDFRPHTSSAEMDFALSYQQLWLFALRDFEQITNETPRKGRAKGKPTPREPSAKMTQSFALRAQLLGFTNSEIVKICKISSELIDSMRLLNGNGYGGNDDRKSAQDIAAILAALEDKRDNPIKAQFAGASSLDKLARCGRPFMEDHVVDKGMFFLPQMYTLPITPASNISTFYRKWNAFRVFFALDKLLPGEFASPGPEGNLGPLRAIRALNTDVITNQEDVAMTASPMKAVSTAAAEPVRTQPEVAEDINLFDAPLTEQSHVAEEGAHIGGAAAASSNGGLTFDINGLDIPMAQPTNFSQTFDVSKNSGFASLNTSTQTADSAEKGFDGRLRSLLSSNMLFNSSDHPLLLRYVDHTGMLPFTYETMWPSTQIERVIRELGLREPNFIKKHHYAFGTNHYRKVPVSTIRNYLARAWNQHIMLTILTDRVPLSTQRMYMFSVQSIVSGNVTERDERSDDTKKRKYKATFNDVTYVDEQSAPRAGSSHRIRKPHRAVKVIESKQSKRPLLIEWYEKATGDQGGSSVPPSDGVTTARRELAIVSKHPGDHRMEDAAQPRDKPQLEQPPNHLGPYRDTREAELYDSDSDVHEASEVDEIT